MEISFKVKNVGNEDESDVYVEAEIKDLEITQKTEEFLIEQYGDDDTEAKTMTISIPKNVSEGQYELILRVVFADGKYEVKQKFSVMSSSSGENSIVVENQELNYINNEPIDLSGFETVDTSKKERDNQKPATLFVSKALAPYYFLIGFFIVGIVGILIVIAVLYRRRF
jgi:hypothetical protein